MGYNPLLELSHHVTHNNKHLADGVHLTETAYTSITEQIMVQTHAIQQSFEKARSHHKRRRHEAEWQKAKDQREEEEEQAELVARRAEKIARKEGIIKSNSTSKATQVSTKNTHTQTKPLSEMLAEILKEQGL